MSTKDNSVYIDHMLGCILRIYEYIESQEHFYSSRIVQDAVVRNLQVLSESSQRVEEDVMQLYPDVPWKQISGFRRILDHDYLGVDLDMIWSVVVQEFPNLHQALSKHQGNL